MVAPGRPGGFVSPPTPTSGSSIYRALPWGRCSGMGRAPCLSRVIPVTVLWAGGAGSSSPITQAHREYNCKGMELLTGCHSS